MIRSIYVNNYKSFVNFKIYFDQVGVLIGKNGSGKSNLLTLLLSLMSFMRGQCDARTSFPDTTLTKWMKSDIQTFELEVSDEKDTYQYQLEISHNKNTGLIYAHKETIKKDETVIVELKDGEGTINIGDSKKKDILTDNKYSALNLIPDNAGNHSIQALKKLINEIIICSPNPKRMDELAANDIYFPEYELQNIASVYLGITQIRPEIISDLWNAMKESNPAFVRSGIGFVNYSKYLALTYKYSDQELEHHFLEISDGEKMLFSLYLLLYGYILQGMTVLLDEPDNFLSLREIQPWCMELEQVLETKGQCIMVSHHPEVIDYYADNYGIWFSRITSGETVLEENPYYRDDEEKLLRYSELIARG